MSGDPVLAKFPTSHFRVLHVDSKVMIFCLGSSKSSAFPVDILELSFAFLPLGNPFGGTVSSFPWSLSLPRSPRWSSKSFCLIESSTQHLVEFLNKRSSITKNPQNLKPLAKTETQCTMVGLCTSFGVMRITPHCQLLQCNVVDLVQVG